MTEKWAYIGGTCALKAALEKCTCQIATPTFKKYVLGKSILKLIKG